MFRRRTLAISTIPVFILLVCASFHFALPQSGSAQPDYLNPQLPVERRMADLLGRMTLEEKVAQTHALWRQKPLIMDEKGNFSPEKAENVIKNGIGEIARGSGGGSPMKIPGFAPSSGGYLGKGSMRAGLIRAFWYGPILLPRFQGEY